jgi:hypothetical protein
LAHLPGKEADKYRQRQGVSWMYLKPPGMDAWEENQKRKQKEEATAEAEGRVRICPAAHIAAP